MAGKSTHRKPKTFGIKKTQNPAEIQILQILQQIQSGALDPKTFEAETRQELLQYLMMEGYSGAECAKILNVSDKTIERDKKSLREKLAVELPPKFLEIMSGQLLQQAEWSLQKLRKLGSDPQNPPELRMTAACRSFELQSELIKTFQSLGLLPTAKHLSQDSKSSENESEPASFADLFLELERLRLLAEQNPLLQEKLNLLFQRLEHLKLTQDVQEVACQIIQEGKPDETRPS